MRGRLQQRRPAQPLHAPARSAAHARRGRDVQLRQRALAEHAIDGQGMALLESLHSLLHSVVDTRRERGVSWGRSPSAVSRCASAGRPAQVLPGSSLRPGSAGSGAAQAGCTGQRAVARQLGTQRRIERHLGRGSAHAHRPAARRQRLPQVGRQRRCGRARAWRNPRGSGVDSRDRCAGRRGSAAWPPSARRPAGRPQRRPASGPAAAMASACASAAAS